MAARNSNGMAKAKKLVQKKQQLMKTNRKQNVLKITRALKTEPCHGM